MVKNGVVILLMSLLFMAACSSIKTQSVLHQGEDELKTNGALLTQFHSVLYYPHEIALQFPGYIVGIEKSPIHTIGNNRDYQTVVLEDGGISQADSAKQIKDSRKAMYVSHVMEFRGEQCGRGNRALYNAYYRKGQDTPEPLGFCNDIQPEEIMPGQAFKKSWDALSILKKEIVDKMKKNPGYTHILVAVMGWNTNQEEAIRNFNSLVSNMTGAAPEGAFNPLFIGVTWPSMWESSWVDPIYKGFSYRNKANDADEVGLGWLGVIIHDVLNNLPVDTPVIVLGHSFGARAASTATCVGPVISRDNTMIKRNRIDKLVCLQGAFSFNRFDDGKGIENIYYPKCCGNAERIFLTASRFDTAMDAALWAPMVGDEEVMHTNNDNPLVYSTSVSPDGHIEFKNLGEERIVYIDADNLIHYNAYQSGGNAHSDIFRKETGKMLWDILSKP